MASFSDERVDVQHRWNHTQMRTSNTRRKPCPSGNLSTKNHTLERKARRKHTSYIINTVSYGDEALIKEDETASGI